MDNLKKSALDMHKKDGIMSNTDAILRLIGENPDRPGLKDTPRRVANAYEEIFRGYDPTMRPKITKFPSKRDKMVLKKDIPFYSMCEHHILPYYGMCHVGYIPDGTTIIGMSKITRLVQYLAAKLTIQEELTDEIARELEKELNPKGIAVTTTALHLCEGMRGAKVPGSEFMITELRGLFLTDERAQNEFIRKTTR